MSFLDAINNSPSVNNLRLQGKLESADIQRLDRQLESLKGLKGSEGIEKASAGFASIFVYQLLQAMRKTVPESNLFGNNSFAMDVYMSMFDEKVANRVAQRKSFGITKMIGDYLEKQYDKDKEAVLGKSTKETAPGIINRLHKSAKANDTKSVVIRVKGYDRFIDNAAQQFKLDPDLIRAVIAQESGGNPAAVSKSGAKGLMQLMDETAQELGVQNILDPGENIRAGTKYLKKMLVTYDGDLPLALAAYNAGPGAVRVHNGIPPYPETENYIENVIKMQKQFRRGENI